MGKENINLCCSQDDKSDDRRSFVEEQIKRKTLGDDETLEMLRLREIMQLT